MKNCDDQIKLIQSKIAAQKAIEEAMKEKERKERIEAYWAEHAEEKEQLLTKKKALEDRKAEFSAELEPLESSRAELENEKSQLAPIVEKIKELEGTMGAIDREIAAIDAELDKDRP